jgi:glutathione peroxidase
MMRTMHMHALALAVATALLATPTLLAEDAMPAAPLDITMNDIDGKPLALSQFKGKVVMLVNVASRCGNTPQYAGLETMYETYKDKGFVTVGFPANNFGAQEPGTNPEIKEFCTGKYNVSFPMMAKVSVKGDDICPLYKYLTTASPKPGEVTWNFAKFLVGRDGTVIDRFDPRTKPEDPKLVSSVEQALAATANAAGGSK